LLPGWLEPDQALNVAAGRGRAMNTQTQPEPTLADHEKTMAMLKERAGGDPDALAEIEDWGERRQNRLPTLRRFVALLGRHGIVGPETNRIDRNFVVAQCYAIATKHGLGMMDYRYRDSQSGPLASLMSIDLHAVELDASAATDGLFPDARSEGEFLAEVRGKGHEELGRMARDAVIPARERMILA